MKKQGINQRNKCIFGSAQSPINFTQSPIILQNHLINVFYEQVKGRLVWEKNYYKLNVDRDGQNKNYVDFTTPDGNTNLRYYLDYIKFKTPGEHMFNHYKPNMEMQFIHTSQNTDDITSSLHNYRRLAISFMIDQNDQEIQNNKFLNEMNIEGENIIQNIIEQVNSSGYFFYYGSLTEEPCTENSVWIVLTKKFFIGSDFLLGIQEKIKTSGGLNGNSRDVVPIKERKIYLFGEGPKQEGALFK